MLTTLLDAIKTQFTSKSYWLGAVMPLLLFLFVNGFLFSRHHSPVLSRWLPVAQSWTQATFQYSLTVALFLTIAYALSVLSAPMLALLEGKHLGFLAFVLYGAQRRKLNDLDQEYDSLLRELRAITSARPGWIAQLRASRQVGKHTGPKMSIYQWTMLWFTASPGQPMTIKERTKLWFKGVRGRWALSWIRFGIHHGCRIRKTWLDRAVAWVAMWLTKYSADANRGWTLDQAHDDLLEAFRFAVNRLQFERIQLRNRRQFHFPGSRDVGDDVSSSSVIAPTTMGNIGRTMRSYALTRYQLDLDIFWTRLQNTMQKNGTSAFQNLQDSKAQLDCMVTMVWLTAVSTVFWLAALLWVYPDSTQDEFRVIGIIGTLFTLIWYGLACQSYLVFADLMRSSVDLFRFDLLQFLHVALPYGSDEERDLWLRLGNTIGYQKQERFTYKTQ